MTLITQHSALLWSKKETLRFERLKMNVEGEGGVLQVCKHTFWGTLEIFS